MEWPRAADVDRLTAFPQASPELRAAPEQGMIQALGWQAPELTFGDVAFSFPIDAWTVGLLMLDMCGCHWGSPKSKSAYVLDMFRQLGTPGAGSPIAALPAFPRNPPQHEGLPWASPCAPLLGHHGLELLHAFLTWDPGARIAVAGGAGRHAYFAPEACPLAGRVEESSPGGTASALTLGCFEGQRHQWNARAGTLAPEILSYLQEDPCTDIGQLVFFEGNGVSPGPPARPPGPPQQARPPQNQLRARSNMDPGSSGAGPRGAGGALGSSPVFAIWPTSKRTPP